MPGPIPETGDALRIKVFTYCNSLDQLGLNTLYYKVTGSVGGMTITQIAEAFAVRVGPLYKSWMSDRSVFLGTSCQNLTGDISIEATSTQERGAGTEGSLMCPGQVSGLIRYKGSVYVAGTTGKFYVPKGRIYVPFPARSWLTLDGDMGAPGLAQLQALAPLLGPTPTLTQFHGTATVSLWLASRRVFNGTYSLMGPPIASDSWATQRRRGDFGARNVVPF